VRLLRALLAAAGTGVAIYFIVMNVALPAFAESLSDEQVASLRQAFAERPYVVMSLVLAVAGLLALPVLGVIRWVYGPLNADEPHSDTRAKQPR
jgi:hypothetical protein